MKEGMGMKVGDMGRRVRARKPAHYVRVNQVRYSNIHFLYILSLFFTCNTYMHTIPHKLFLVLYGIDENVKE